MICGIHSKWLPGETAWKGVVVLSSEEYDKCVKAAKEVQDNIEAVCSDIVARMKQNPDETIPVSEKAQECLAPLYKAVHTVLLESEAIREEYQGQAFALTEVDGPGGDFVIPEQVRNSPTLCLHMSIFPSETKPRLASETFRELAGTSEPFVLRGRAEGMKEAVCHMIDQFYAQLRGDV